MSRSSSLGLATASWKGWPRHNSWLLQMSEVLAEQIGHLGGRREASGWSFRLKDGNEFRQPRRDSGIDLTDGLGSFRADAVKDHGECACRPERRLTRTHCVEDAAQTE